MTAPRTTMPAARVRSMGRQPYIATWRAMQDFTDRRTRASADQLWVVEHPPVFTLGLAAKREHLLAPGEIPVVHTDRGGQVTYHGPGQLVVYTLLDLRRLTMGPRRLVTTIEEAIIACLESFGVSAHSCRQAPGVYVDERKIASIGLRVRRGCSYHGLALNVDADLAAFERINPCGYPGLRVTRLADLAADADMASAEQRLLPELLRSFGWPPAPVDKPQPDYDRAPH